MNKVFLIGRLTKDPELRYTGSNVPVVRFTLAINRPFANQNGEKEADFISVVAWRKQAENIKNYINKGSQVAVDGRIQTGNYKAQDGTTKYTTEVIADRVQFLDSKKSSNNNSYENVSQEEPEPEVKGTNIESNPFENFGTSTEINDDDLPF